MINNKKISIAARALAIGMVAALVLAGTAMGEMSISNENETLFSDGFEDNLTQWSIRYSGDIKITQDKAHSGSNSLRIIKQEEPPPYDTVQITHYFERPVKGKLTVWFYDTGNGYNIVRLADPYTFVDVGTNYNLSYYYYFPFSRIPDYNVSGVISNVPRSRDWHKFEIDVTATGTKVIIDGKIQQYESMLNEINTIQLGGRGRVDAYWDDLIFIVNTKPQQEASQALPKTPGFGVILAGIGMILALALRRR